MFLHNMDYPNAYAVAYNLNPKSKRGLALPRYPQTADNVNIRIN